MLTDDLLHGIVCIISPGSFWLRNPHSTTLFGQDASRLASLSFVHPAQLSLRSSISLMRYPCPGCLSMLQHEVASFLLSPWSATTAREMLLRLWWTGDDRDAITTSRPSAAPTSQNNNNNNKRVQGPLVGHFFE